MFVRVKTSNNGKTTYVQIVQSIRKGGSVRQKIVRHVGVAKNESDLRKLKLLAESIKPKLEAGAQQFLFSPEEIVALGDSRKKYPEEDYEVNLKNLTEEQRMVAGIHDVYGKLFRDLGYRKVIDYPSRNKSKVRYFKNIVLSRIANPVSKRSTVGMLEEDFGLTLNLDKVYRMMDSLDSSAIERLKDITYKNTATLFGQKISVIFYDATTIYFESFSQDSFKKNGFSKDQKHSQPQVLLALMVTEEGLPVDYNLFSGNTFEGNTLIPAISKIRKKYDIGKVVFVADSAMLSEANTAALEDAGISYIVGARLKNLEGSIKDKILDCKNYKEIYPGYLIATFKYKGKNIIVSYSQKRAKKDSFDREVAIDKLLKKIDKSKNAKSHLGSYGYRKYLKVKGPSKISIDTDKIKAYARWDGLHGVITNSNLSPDKVLEKYNDLWNVEAAFRVTKHDLAVRPVYHWKPRRIKAHIAICFAAYSLVKHLEYRVRLQYRKLSPEKIRQILMKVQTSILYDKSKKIRYGLPSKMKRDARNIYKILNLKRSITPYIIEKK